MNFSEQLTQIIAHQDQTTLLSFLQELPLDQRRTLVPAVKQLAKEYFEYHVNSSGNWQQKSSHKQREMLIMTAFVTMSRQEYTRLDAGGWQLNRKLLDIILPWYCPTWFSDYINALAEQSIPQWLHYLQIIEWQEQGFLRPTPELIARLLPQVVLNYQRNVRVFRSENLFKYAVTLDEHLWYLFQYESVIHWNDRFAWQDASGKAQEQNWSKILAALADQGSIDRFRLLRETVLATTRFQNKNLVGWFVDLFAQLAPTPEELLSLQAELSATFYGSYSKPITMALKYYKQLVANERFDEDSWLESASVLLMAETKSIVTSALMIMDKLARRCPERANQVSELAAQALMHSDSALQVRAAKLICRHGDREGNDLRETVASYGDPLNPVAKALLSDFGLSEKGKELLASTSLAVPPQVGINQKLQHPVQPTETVDDLIFLASQAFDNNDPLHLDLLPAALISLQSDVNEDTIVKLLPAFQRAYRLLMGDWRSTLGVLDHLLANFFIDYGQLLIKQFPIASSELQTLHEGFVQRDREESTRWSWIGRRIEPLDQWHTHDHDPIYRPFKQLLTEALAALRQGHGLPRLSTPTHAPYWIDPVTLVTRLQCYQQQGAAPGEADWQVALSRTVLDDITSAARLARKTLRGEFQSLMCFLLEKDGVPPSTITRPGIWMVAALTKDPTTARRQYPQWNWPPLPTSYSGEELAWEVTVTDHHYQRYDYTLRKYQRVPYQQKTLRLNASGSPSPNKLQRAIRKLFAPLAASELVIHQHVELKTPYLSVEHNDVARYFSLLPNCPDPLLALVIRQSLADGRETTHPALLTATLQALLNGPSTFGPAAHLLIATSMLSNHKTIRVLAAECWIKGVDEKALDSEQIGNIIGQQESVEFAPLQRFTDLLSTQLLRVSSQHNQALARLLTACLVQLPDTPIRGLRKLLEIYQGVAYHADYEGDAKVQAKLEAWQSVTILKKVTTTLLANDLALAG